MKQKAITQIAVGHKVSFSKMVTDEDIRKFAEVSGDFNPLHMDDQYARKTIFGERIAHGILVLGLISTALAKLPGTVVYLSQNARFLRPVKLGDKIEAVVEVVEKTEEKRELRLKTICLNHKGEMVVDGEARVKIFDVRQ